MSLTTHFIAELIRAANEADRLTRFEVKRLLNRSVDTIREMSRQTGVAGSHRALNVVIDIQVASARAPRPVSSGDQRRPPGGGRHHQNVEDCVGWEGCLAHPVSRRHRSRRS